jgi:hypothetical protein
MIIFRNLGPTPIKAQNNCSVVYPTFYTNGGNWVYNVTDNTMNAWDGNSTIITSISLDYKIIECCKSSVK